MTLKNIFHKLTIYIYILTHQKTFQNRIKYIFDRSKKLDSIMIIFSAFDLDNRKRKFNYIKSFKSIKCDKLFISDPYGFKGSYFWFENGESYPIEQTSALLQSILEHKKYKNIYTLGTSKGGTTAIYYGLKINANSIFAGACQYNIGNYLTLPKHIPIFKAMMGENAGEVEKVTLNHVLKNQIEAHSTYNGIIHLVYSKKEPTYENDIIDLINKIKSYNLNLIEKEFSFNDHNEVGKYFIRYIHSIFS